MADVLDTELESLRRENADLRRAVASLRSDNGLTARRGVLATAGTIVEKVCKFVYRREGLDTNGKPTEKLMLQDLLQEFQRRPGVLPVHVVNHIHMVQSWRNMGAHDKGDIERVSASTIQAVEDAKEEVVRWYFVDYRQEQHEDGAAVGPFAPPDQDGSHAFAEWRELLWWVGRTGTIKSIDERGLIAEARTRGIGDVIVARTRAEFRRDLESFCQLIDECVAEGVIEEHVAAGLEDARVETCVSEREARLRWLAQGAGVQLPATRPAWLELVPAAVQPTEPPSSASHTGEAAPLVSVAPPSHEPAPAASKKATRHHHVLVQVLPLRGAGTFWSIADGLDCVIGRKSSCAIQIPSQSLERRHALVRRDGKRTRVVPLDNDATVVVDGVALRGEHVLTDGQVIAVGEALLVWKTTVTDVSAVVTEYRNRPPATLAQSYPVGVHTGVGMAVGGAVGQLLIPIPGVGAAAGAAIGGMIGKWLK